MVKFDLFWKDHRKWGKFTSGSWPRLLRREISAPRWHKYCNKSTWPRFAAMWSTGSLGVKFIFISSNLFKKSIYSDFRKTFFYQISNSDFRKKNLFPKFWFSKKTIFLQISNSDFRKKKFLSNFKFKFWKKNFFLKFHNFLKFQFTIIIEKSFFWNSEFRLSKKKFYFLKFLNFFSEISSISPFLYFFILCIIYWFFHSIFLINFRIIFEKLDFSHYFDNHLKNFPAISCIAPRVPFIYVNFFKF